MEKYLKYAEYDLEVSDSESTVALDQVALSNIDGHRFYDAEDGDEERTEKGKPNTSAFTRVEKSEAFLAAGVNWSDSREPVVGFVRYATDKSCLNAFYAFLRCRRNEQQPATNDFLPKKFSKAALPCHHLSRTLNLKAVIKENNERVRPPLADKATLIRICGTRGPYLEEANIGVNVQFFSRNVWSARAPCQ